MAPYATYYAAAGQRDFVVPFPFLNRSHVRVRANGALQTLAPWPGPNMLRLLLPVATGSFIEIERITPLEDPLVSFQNGSVLTAEDLNTAILQLLYRQQELDSLYGRTLASAKDRLAELGGVSVPSEDVFDTLVEQMLGSSVLDELKSRLGDIDLNAQAILQETQDRIISVTTETENRVQQINGLQTQIGEVQSYVIQALNSGGDDEEAYASALLALSASYSSSRSQFQQKFSAVSTETEALAVAISGVQAQIGDASSLVASEQLARITADSALALRIDGVETTMNGHTASITETAASINGMLLKHSVKLNSNGHITGFEQNNDGTTGSFTVVADQFRVVTPDGSTVRTPFVVTGSGVQIDGNLVVTGSITSPSLADNSVVTAKIVYNAVTLPINAYTAAEISVSTGAWVSIQAVTINSIGAPILIAASAVMRVAAASTASTRQYRFRILRNGVESYLLDGASYLNFTGSRAAYYPIGCSFSETPGSGTFTYEVQVYLDDRAEAFSRRSLTSVEMRR